MELHQLCWLYTAGQYNEQMSHYFHVTMSYIKFTLDLFCFKFIMDIYGFTLLMDSAGVPEILDNLKVDYRTSIQTTCTQYASLQLNNIRNLLFPAADNSRPDLNLIRAELSSSGADTAWSRLLSGLVLYKGSIYI